MQSYRQEIDSILGRVHFFNYLTNKDKEVIIENTFLFRLHEEEKIFEKDQNANSFFIVKKGSVRI
jgi:CRP-like cAMP-binding protein